ncbi:MULTISPECIES: SagB/ThcOx family dehydrogenase [Methylococcus]|uniref:SagB/ThcOx family dehydrogenase n=1 Tax=Methylococcus capsulatus TaxID=414 RepID=A0ABZ2F9X7_METCP|nr:MULTISPECIES: SagB/ThcOx family dehydrogenase [Methylococcus]MDF9392694.1 SagB/ThcOx family dehydrogenase [Methylococcus capsulatus]
MRDTDTGRIPAYHERTKHRLERYAAGPETLDWSAQPDPFRTFEGTDRILLPLQADRLDTSYPDLHRPDAVPPRALTLDSVGLLLELSLALSAWKEYGPDRWSLRCNPSSGNLHPTEGYVVCQNLEGLDDGIYHYLSRDHALERRARATAAPPGSPSRLLLGLSSIHWREAWKYGERGFRYCQLDTGHAIGALRYAAAALGWGLRQVDTADADTIARLLGLDRAGDFLGAEAEEAELLLEVVIGQAAPPALPVFADLDWAGKANVLDPHPMYHWPVIDEVADASRGPLETTPPPPETDYPPRADLPAVAAAAVIRQRRSAQRFDRRFELARTDFYALLDALLVRPGVPWDVWNHPPALHPVLFVHRVTGLAPGLYALPRSRDAETKLRAVLRPDFAWTKPSDCPPHLPLFLLAEGSCVPLARTIACHQAIAADSAFALGMLAEFEDILSIAPWRYRQLHWQAGLLGQVLYLEAEARRLRGTGIGCYFDDAFHELLGLSGKAFQSLYHFTVGQPLDDPRITTEAPYPRNRA